MQLTIIPIDNVVIIDGVARTIDCSAMDPAIHAVQWNENSGEVEFKTIDGIRAPNLMIDSLADFEPQVDAWNNWEPPPPPQLPPPLPPRAITRRQLLLVLYQLGFITGEEALAAAATGAEPALISNYIATMPEEAQLSAKITWAAMSVCERNHPMLLALTEANNISAGQLDALFLAASYL